MNIIKIRVEINEIENRKKKSIILRIIFFLKFN